MNLLSQDGMTYTYADNKITSEVVFVLTQISADLEARVAARSVWEARIHHFSFTIWAALLLATPFGDWKKKVLIFFVGWAIVFGGQLFALFVETLSEKSVFLQSSAQFEQYRLPPTEEYILRWGGRFFLLIGNKLLPLLLWFAWGLPKLLRSPERAVKSREPEPTPVS